MSKDDWQGDSLEPMSFNPWLYVHGNPVEFTDPSGFIELGDVGEADGIVSFLNSYNITIDPDWSTTTHIISIPVPDGGRKTREFCTLDNGGVWSILELRLIKFTIERIDASMGGSYRSLLGPYKIEKVKTTKCDRSNLVARGCTTGNGKLIELRDSNQVPTNADMNANIISDGTNDGVNSTADINFDAFSLAHEIGHAWDQQHSGAYSQEIKNRTGGKIKSSYKNRSICKTGDEPKYQRLPGCNDVGYIFGGTPLYGGGNTMNPAEDFANSFAVYIFPSQAQARVDYRYNYQNGQLSQYSQYYHWSMNDPSANDYLYKNPRWLYLRELMTGMLP
jgi:hypothetical protein